MKTELISPGKTGIATTTVTKDNTASAIKSGALDVFSTPMMIALMECAACECLADCLDDGEASVGTAVDIEHLAASPVGAKITATAAINGIDGRKIEFAVTANDEQREIGKGKHSRFVVDTERFLKKAKG